MTHRVLITCPQMQRHADEYVRRLEALGIAAEVPPVVQQLSENELIAMIDRFDGIILGDDPLSRRVLEHATKLRIISKWGVGVDNIDLAAAADLGIPVTNTPGAFGEEVADVVIGYLILLSRQLHRTDAGTRIGAWPKIEGFSLRGRTLGVVGLGSIGLALASRGAAHGMRVVGTDVFDGRHAEARALGLEVASLEQVLKSADLLSLCCPLTAANRHMLDTAAFAQMRPGSYLVNTARGGLVDEAALVGALQSGKLAGAALDVFETEPLPAGSPLRAFDNVILGAHNASNTIDAVRRVNELAMSNLLHGLGVAQ
jgi:D-3-phosphoglycerate dehydrogenase / 2-oxoglutarate reductase